MGRLTFKKWFEFYKPDEETTTISIKGYKQIIEREGSRGAKSFYLVGEAVDKLAAYEDAEEQGLLIRLPCSVGDSVYCILPHKDFAIESIVDEFIFSNIVYVIVRDKTTNTRRGIPYCEKGKTFFLIKEEAEAALKALQEGE